MKITWDQYQLYCICPQWYCWDYQIPKPKGQFQRDTRYLVQGNTIQRLVAEWFSLPYYRQSNYSLSLDKFLADRVVSVLTQEWVQDWRGSPRIPLLEMASEIKTLLSKSLVVLTEHIIADVSIQDKDSIQVCAELSVESAGPFNTILSAVLDLLVTKLGQCIIYEGKSTKYPDRILEDQVRWQAQILADNIYPLTADHYYIFYRTAEVRKIQVFEGQEGKSHQGMATELQEVFCERRDQILKRMVEGDMKPIPTRSGCHICTHLDHCPDKFVPRTEIKSEEAFSGVRMDVL